MDVHLITLFPEFFEGPLTTGVLHAASRKERARYQIVNLRDFARDRHRTVDDYPYGGGPGMILMAPPLVEAVESVVGSVETGPPGGSTTIVLPTPAGPVLTPELASRLARQERLIFLCGRYKGVDERVFDLLDPTPVSIGDYVLSGGDLPALVILESVVRLIPGVLGDRDSADTDSFSESRNGFLDSAYYTRPEEYRKLRVPDVLCSGNHAAIEEWRRRSSLERTKNIRPDLLER
jgi:tRNA (guanine37-N1)-methyltransferase